MKKLRNIKILLNNSIMTADMKFAIKYTDKTRKWNSINAGVQFANVAYNTLMFLLMLWHLLNTCLS